MKSNNGTVGPCTTFSDPSRPRLFPARLRAFLSNDSASRVAGGGETDIRREGKQGTKVETPRDVSNDGSALQSRCRSRSSSPRPPRPGGVGEMMMEVAHRPSQFAQISTRSQFSQLCWSVQGSAKECSLGCVNLQPESGFTQPRDHSSAEPFLRLFVETRINDTMIH